MMNAEMSLIIAAPTALPVISINPAALQNRDAALGAAALIGKVENAEQNQTAVKAHIALKQIAAGFERDRKKCKEPASEYGRAIDRAVGEAVADVEKEIGRIACLTSQFQLAEQRRVREEEEIQRRELARIESEKQAELYRIQREKDEAERKAREAAAEADRLAKEATNKKTREAAEKARIESERLKKEADTKAAQAGAEIQKVNETAQAAAAVEAKPIVATRTAGQVIKTDWEITVTNPYELARFHPDCVEVTAKLAPIKAALNEGRTVKGITATKITMSGVRAGAGRMTIDV